MQTIKLLHPLGITYQHAAVIYKSDSRQVPNILYLVLNVCAQIRN
jgi:hypothetical protein